MHCRGRVGAVLGCEVRVRVGVIGICTRMEGWVKSIRGFMHYRGIVIDIRVKNPITTRGSKGHRIVDRLRAW